MLGPKLGYAEIIKPEIEAYYGRCFERLCRECLPMIYQAEGVRSAFECGEYWDKNVQIDVVGVRKDGWTDLGECKWGDVNSMPALVKELDSRLPLYPNHREATLGRRLFVRSIKTRPKLSGVTLHTLDDLYRLKPALQ